MHVGCAPLHPAAARTLCRALVSLQRRFPRLRRRYDIAGVRPEPRRAVRALAARHRPSRARRGLPPRPGSDQRVCFPAGPMVLGHLQPGAREDLRGCHTRGDPAGEGAARVRGSRRQPPGVHVQDAALLLQRVAPLPDWGACWAAAPLLLALRPPAQLLLPGQSPTAALPARIDIRFAAAGSHDPLHSGAGPRGASRLYSRAGGVLEDDLHAGEVLAHVRVGAQVSAGRLHGRPRHPTAGRVPWLMQPGLG
mmetsp:Transcript_29576/g.92342  ORF Transcript_29576/g.92342 Transcript_29576/m.92342 type:complete len:251 (+) Transcript_29576:906-1658(+)